MKWILKSSTQKRPPENGALRYRLRFAWYPVRVEETNKWPRQRIWLETVVEVQRWGGYSVTGSWKRGWFHNNWMPLNEFSRSLYLSNNQ